MVRPLMQERERSAYCCGEAGAEGDAGEFGVAGGMVVLPVEPVPVEPVLGEL